VPIKLDDKMKIIWTVLLIVFLGSCGHNLQNEKAYINLDSLLVIKDTIYFETDTVILRNDISLLNKLMQVNLKKYIGKSVEQLLKDTVINKYKNFWWEDEPPGVLNSLNLTYSRGLYLKIYFKDLKYSSRFTEKCEWELKLIKKEEIGSLVIAKDEFMRDIISEYTRKK
jgi:hypothetical protein